MKCQYSIHGHLAGNIPASLRWPAVRLPAPGRLLHAVCDCETYLVAFETSPRSGKQFSVMLRTRMGIHKKVLAVRENAVNVCYNDL